MEKEFWQYIRKDEPWDWEYVIWSSMKHTGKCIAKGKVIGGKLLLTDLHGNPVPDSDTYTHWCTVQAIPSP